MATSPNILSSPISTTSYDLVSSLSLSDRADSTSDDEVVWLPQGASVSSYESSIVSDTDDDDFVLLSRSRSPLRNAIHTSAEESTSTDIELSSAISGLSLGQTFTSHRPAARGTGIERHSSAVTLKKAPVSLKLKPSLLGGGLSESQKRKKAKRKAARKARKAARAGSSSFPIVDDASSDTGTVSSVSTVSGYEDAASFITSFLSSPESNKSVCKLTLLHSLIIELGLSASCTLPGSLTAAKALLKSEAHINIKEYIAVRGQGQAAIRNAMHPSRSALVKDIRKTGNRASLKWVKSQGLQVLLVNCFH